MLLVLCDDAVRPATRDWCRDALRAGLSASAGRVFIWTDAASMPPTEASGEPCVVWLTSDAERDVIAAAAAAASEIVLVLGSAVGLSASRSGGGAQAWHAAAAVAVPRVALWLPAAGGGQGDPTGELSAALGADRVVRLKRMGTRGAYRQMHRLGRGLSASACAPQRLDRSDGAVRRRNAARAATDALEDLLAEPDVEEFQIRGGESMLVQYAGGRVERRSSPFAADEDLIEAVRFLAGYSGDRPQRFDELDPRLDVRVGDRWRLHAEAFVTSPPNVVLRSNMAGRIRLDDLGIASPELGSVLIEAITGRVRANVVVAATMGGGKTTLCQALLAAVPDHERIDTIEDTPELRLHEYGIHPNTYERLTRDPNQDGHGRHSMADHIRDAKRANAAKLVVGEIRGEGCEALLDAMSSGLDGCLVTLHSQPGKGVLEKLVAYACSEGAEPDYARRQIAAAVDLCVWLGRNDAGERVVADVTQLTGIDELSGVISTTCLWALRPGDRWATLRGRPVGRVAQIYGAAGVALDNDPQPHGPALFSQIVDTPTPELPPADDAISERASAPAGGPALGDPALGDLAAGDPALGDPAAGDPAVGDLAVGDPAASSDPGGASHLSNPTPCPQSPERSERVTGRDAGQVLATPPRDPQTRPEIREPGTATEPVPVVTPQDSPMFDAAACDGARSGDVLWDPGPLVPIDNPAPYEPLVEESWLRESASADARDRRNRDGADQDLRDLPGSQQVPPPKSDLDSGGGARAAEASC